MTGVRLVLAAILALCVLSCSQSDYSYVKEGEPVADAIVRAVTKNWDAAELVSRADPTMLKDFPEPKIRDMIDACSKFIGQVRDVKGLAGEVMRSSDSGKVARYTFAVDGEKSKARIQIILQKRQSDWTVMGFWTKG